MVYSGGFVICILVNGQVQEERSDGIVIVPEGTEYAIRLRNKNTRRAVGRIFIDNENVSDGGYVINAHGYVDIYRFANKDEAFKVAGLNSPEAVDAGKNGPNDGTKGVVEVRFQLEKEREVYNAYPLLYNKRSDWPKPGPWKADDRKRGLRSRNPGYESEEKTSGGIVLGDVNGGMTSFDCDVSRSLTSNRLEDAVTVGGSTTGQRFSTTHVDLESQEIILKVILKIGEPKLKAFYCSKCGSKLGKTDRFCSKCGKQIIVAR